MQPVKTFTFYGVVITLGAATAEEAYAKVEHMLKEVAFATDTFTDDQGPDQTEQDTATLSNYKHHHRS